MVGAKEGYLRKHSRWQAGRLNNTRGRKQPHLTPRLIKQLQICTQKHALQPFRHAGATSKRQKLAQRTSSIMVQAKATLLEQLPRHHSTTASSLCVGSGRCTVVPSATSVAGERV